LVAAANIRFAIRQRRRDVGPAILVASVAGLQVAAIRELGPGEAPQAALRGAIFLSPVLLLPVLLLQFRKFAGAWLIAGGLILNLIPMAAHGGLMSVAIERVTQFETHQHLTQAGLGRGIPGPEDVLLRQHVLRFELLSDRFRADRWGLPTGLFSVGDVVELTGIVAAVAQVLGGAWFVRHPANNRAGRALASPL